MIESVYALLELYPNARSFFLDSYVFEEDLAHSTDARRLAEHHLVFRLRPERFPMADIDARITALLRAFEASGRRILAVPPDRVPGWLELTLDLDVYAAEHGAGLRLVDGTPADRLIHLDFAVARPLVPQ